MGCWLVFLGACCAVEEEEMGFPSADGPQRWVTPCRAGSEGRAVGSQRLDVVG